MKKYVKVISLFLVGLVMLGVGLTYAFFDYAKVGQNTKVIAGSLYLTLNEGQDTINISNMLPETKEEARARNDNTLTFTLKGKNTSTTKDINYEILLNNGTANEDSNKDRIDTKDLVFDLVEIGNNNEETYILNAVSYDELADQKIWVDSIEKNTTSEVEKTYRLRMWISEDVVISDTDPNADYTTEEYANRYASVKVAVEGDLQDKILPLLATVSNVLNANNEPVVTNEIRNINSENNQDTYGLTITSSNNNVKFVYTDNNEEVVVATFEEEYTITNNDNVTFTYALRSESHNEETADLTYTLTKNGEIVQTIIKHVTVPETARQVPHIQFVDKSGTYNGSAITLDSVTITNSDNTAYTGTTTYTYYKGTGCSGQEIASAPVNVGTYSVKIYAAGTGTDGSTSSCGTITIAKKSLVASIDSCTNREYTGTTGVVCTTSVSGKVGNEVVSVSGTCNVGNATAGNNKTVTCSSLALAGIDKDNYELSANSVEKSNAVNITKANLSIKAASATFDYGSTVPSFTYTATGFVNGETESVLTGAIAYTIKNQNNVTVQTIDAPGVYTIIPSGFTSDNYDITYENGKYTVRNTKTDITPSVGLCTDRAYDGTTNVTCTINLPGVASGDTVTATGTCTVASKDANDNAKTVTCTGITLSGANAGKYLLTTTTASKNNAVTISKKSVTPVISSCSNKVYDGTTSASCTYSAVSEKVGSDVVSLTGGTCTFNNKNVGTGKTVTCSSISLTGANSGNYALSTTSATKTANITAKEITVTAANKSMNYGASAPTYTSTITGVIGEETGYTGTVTYTIKSGNTTINDVSTAAAGTYDIIPGGLTAGSNYTITYVNGTLTINKVAATISCSNKTYNGTEQTACTCSGGTIGGEYKATNYRATAYTASCTPDANHTAAEDVTWTMSKKAVTVTAGSSERAWNGSALTNSACTVTTGSLVTGHSVTCAMTSGSTITTAGTVNNTIDTYTIKDGSNNTVTDNYNVTKATGTLTVTLATPTVTLTAKSEADRTYTGNQIEANTATVSPDAGGAITYKYYTNSTCSEGETTTAPTNAETYYVKATVAAVANKTNVAYSSCVNHSIVRAKTATKGSCANPTYAGSAQDIVTHGTGVTYSGNSQTNVKTDGDYTVTVTPDSNHAWSDGSTTADTLSCNITPKQCNTPTDVAISTAGIVTWTNSSNCSQSTHKVKVADGSYATATSGVDKNSDITASTGSRTVSVIAVPGSTNYSTSAAASASVAVRSVTLTKGTGISAVSGAGKYISGATVTLGATISDTNNYKWSKWTYTSDGTTWSTTKAYSHTISANWALTANAVAQLYTKSKYNCKTGTYNTGSPTYVQTCLARTKAYADQNLSDYWSECASAQPTFCSSGATTCWKQTVHTRIGCSTWNSTAESTTTGLTYANCSASQNFKVKYTCTKE